jgi:DNA-binding winged helix-turn-helix (wHTH) protein
MTDKIRIGDWVFEPDTGILAQDEVTVRLENRAATLLELLVETSGQLVSQSAIIDRVWEGRAVSPNSVAVVVSDLRRALNDDPKAPRILETLPKRGYRLIADVSVPNADAAPSATEQASATRPGWTKLWATLAAVVTLVIVIMSLGAGDRAALDRVSISVLATVNDTGDEGYLPLSRSVTELLAVHISQYDQFEVLPVENADLMISSKLILWDGHPSMAIYAESSKTGEIVWSGMAKGPETLLPQQVEQEVSELALAAQPDQVNR